MTDPALARPASDSATATPRKVPHLRQGCGCVASEQLFKGARELVIEHNGDVYHLRITRNEKLILTK